MSITNPYYRISRPFKNEIHNSLEYIRKYEYSNERYDLCNSFNLIIQDLSNLFFFVEPSKDNFNTYSHRIYELFLRTCTEVEANFKGILRSNIYTPPPKRNLNIEDYYKIDKSSKLSEYAIKILFWKENDFIFKPFESWKSGWSLNWYQSYNEVKHNRLLNFKEASLENLVNAICGLIVLLYSQFNLIIFSQFDVKKNFVKDNEDFLYYPSSIFGIKEPIWDENEKYFFDGSLNYNYQKFDFDL